MIFPISDIFHPVAKNEYETVGLKKENRKYTKKNPPYVLPYGFFKELSLTQGVSTKDFIHVKGRLKYQLQVYYEIEYAKYKGIEFQSAYDEHLYIHCLVKLGVIAPHRKLLCCNGSENVFTAQKSMFTKKMLALIPEQIDRI